ncbi:hypothetical protein AYJ08_00350 [Brevibacillus sp. SKDU10]|uniref:DUF6877 family protein n=1 Tax=Brevibacillus sp. SKDU10 TaxID=1247872 RepID=UPI0007C987E4|nr:DUF6877 family protein [Brevibacillus sp. SKDU10]OAJ75234.1 hypothetical protein AYJ08_00350 [Brevibacillus sp. SKDU10]
MTYLEQITKITGQLPLEVLLDINQRIGDWLASGGKEDDLYIQQQLRYAERILKLNSECDENEYCPDCWPDEN